MPPSHSLFPSASLSFFYYIYHLIIYVPFAIFPYNILSSSPLVQWWHPSDFEISAQKGTVFLTFGRKRLCLAGRTILVREKKKRYKNHLGDYTRNIRLRIVDVYFRDLNTYALRGSTLLYISMYSIYL